MNDNSVNEPIISIIMATYNSESTIEWSLKSIRNQSIGRNVEILVIDGGSTDKTRVIASKYDCIILDNPDRLPEIAKRIGMQKCTGKYIQIMDSDEVLPDNKVLEKRIGFMDENTSVMCLLARYIPPKGTGISGKYISAVGDPFTAFAYKWFIDGNMGIIKKANIGTIKGEYIGSFSKDDIIPIGDSCTLFRGDYLRDKYGELFDKVNTTVLFQMTVNDTGLVGHIEGDDILHYTSSSFGTYLRKLKFRVINNVFDKNGSGYSAVAEHNNALSKRKYGYPFYCISIVLPVIDAVRMTFYYKDLSFLLHPVYAWYVMIQIIVQLLLKVSGRKQENQQYG